MSDDERGYNGWTNYETWVVKLWIDNDEGSYNYWRETARELMETGEYRGVADRTTIDLSDMLKEEHEDALPELEGFASDLMRAAFSDVDWYEIATSLIEEVTEEDAYVNQN